MNDIDKMVVEDGVIKIKEAEKIIPEQVIPATETIISKQVLISRKEKLEAHFDELQKSVNNDLAQMTIMQSEVDKINVLLGGVPSDENVPIDGANGVG